MRRCLRTPVHHSHRPPPELQRKVAHDLDPCRQALQGVEQRDDLVALQHQAWEMSGVSGKCARIETTGGGTGAGAPPLPAPLPTPTRAPLMPVEGALPPQSSALNRILSEVAMPSSCNRGAVRGTAQG